MRYEGSIYRPPSEAYSLIVQVTIGCAHNSCTFCSMFKDKQFRVRNVQEVLEDLRIARRTYKQVGKIFLADGDALVLTNEKLMVILKEIEELFPECDRVGIYGTPQDVNTKTLEELRERRDAGLGIIYIGAESGNDQVLTNIKAILEAAGLTMDNVAKTTVFLQDMGDFAAMNAVYAEFFTEGQYPARSAVEVGALPRGALVEIETICVK